MTRLLLAISFKVCNCELSEIASLILRSTDLSIEEFVPKTGASIDNLGFLFGAGTSFESGYPLVTGLTKSVVGALPANDRTAMDEILAASGLTYDDKFGLPNIEEISDLVIEYHTNSQLEKYQVLKEKIRELVRDVILGVSDPDITNQVALLERLKSRAYERATNVWFFTTNYDLLIEDACAEVGLKLVNGFVGATTRHFSEQEFSMVSGVTRGSGFKPESGLTVRLVKLHGSVSWYRQQDRIFEAAPSAITEQNTRCMVLPRRTKVIETLSRPYDRLFHVSNSILSSRCKYLISSGFSFGDSHINDSLMTPHISSGGISLTNFCEVEPEGLSDLRARPNVLHVCKDKKLFGGLEHAESSEAWKFSKFVELF